MTGGLDARLIAAHAAADTGALVDLYRQAATEAEAQGQGDRAGFYMTHAYVFALEAGSDDAAALKAWLIERHKESEQ